MTRKFERIGRSGAVEVRIDPEAQYGYAEHDEEGEMGGLWFNADGELDDYDGQYSLDEDTRKAIIDAGFSVPDDME